MYKNQFSKFRSFVKKWQNHYAKLQKMWKSKKLHFSFFTISPILFKLQRCTIPHFKALDKLFWPLAWVLTVGAITFVLLRKMSVYFFSWHTLVILQNSSHTNFFCNFCWTSFPGNRTLDLSGRSPCTATAPQGWKNSRVMTFYSYLFWRTV